LGGPMGTGRTNHMGALGRDYTCRSTRGRSRRVFVPKGSTTGRSGRSACCRDTSTRNATPGCSSSWTCTPRSWRRWTRLRRQMPARSQAGTVPRPVQAAGLAQPLHAVAVRTVRLQEFRQPVVVHLATGQGPADVLGDVVVAEA